MEVKDDPSLVKMIIRQTGVYAEGLGDRQYQEKTIPHHQCTEEDYAGFYPIIA